MDYKMYNVREILAQNLKENRRKLGITQPMLAERAGLSTHYLAMIEIARKFPSADVLDRLAEALNITPNELFTISISPEKAMKQMQQAILDDLNRAIEHALDKAIEKRWRNGIQPPKTDPLPT
jgi:transcriptional regulator with XRE-family HTH domain